MRAPLDLSSFQGSVSPEEVEFLRAHAAEVARGCIVEVGSWRGKSAIALAVGASEVPEHQRPLVYCIDPHRPAVGVYGGRFGPHDRPEFYKAMLRAGCAEAVALINLPSTAAARAFAEPIGLLFIDGDHTEVAVQADVDAWTPHMLPGAMMLLDDAIDPDVGPYKVIARLTASGGWRVQRAVGKIVALEMVGPA